MKPNFFKATNLLARVQDTNSMFRFSYATPKPQFVAFTQTMVWELQMKIQTCTK